MASKQSAGLLPYRWRDGVLELFLVHPGGPFWARKDDGSWSIAKGEFEPGDDPLQAALREFEEETGFVSAGRVVSLGELKQPSGKIVQAWAEQASYRAEDIRSNSFMIEWPKGSGRQQSFPEIDRAGWFPIEEARKKLLKGQVAFIDRLLTFLDSRSESARS